MEHPHHEHGDHQESEKTEEGCRPNVDGARRAPKEHTEEDTCQGVHGQDVPLPQEDNVENADREERSWGCFWHCIHFQSKKHNLMDKLYGLENLLFFYH